MPGLPIIPFLLGALAASTAAESAPPGQPGAEEARRSPDSGGAAEASHPFSTVVIDRRDRSTAQADPAAAGSVVTLDRAPRSGETLADLVSELPGVAVNRLGGLGGLALMSVRGSTWEQVRVLVDGVPLNSAAGGGVDLSSIPLSDIERIEVYRGLLRGLHDEAASIPRDEQFVPHLEECLARHESAARGALDGPRALVKAGPSLGLLGTLIPMGSSLAALSQGNLEAMSGRMVAAFTSTIIGLATGTLAFSIVARRQRWLEQDLRELRLLADLIAGERSR